MQLQPNQFMTDWELSERNAVKRVYPLVDLRGCWFHYCSAIRKRRGKMGLKFHRLLKNSFDARLLYTELLQIPLLPVENIEDGFCAIKGRAQTLGKSWISRFIQVLRKLLAQCGKHKQNGSRCHVVLIIHIFQNAQNSISVNGLDSKAEV